MGWSANARVLKQGFLYKRRKNGTWKRCMFVLLDNQFLCYFKRREDLKPRGSIDIANAHPTLPPPRRGRPSKPNVFVIRAAHGSKQHFTLAAETPRELSDWVAAIRRTAETTQERPMSVVSQSWKQAAGVLPSLCQWREPLALSASTMERNAHMAFKELKLQEGDQVLQNASCMAVNYLVKKDLKQGNFIATGTRDGPKSNVMVVRMTTNSDLHVETRFQQESDCLDMSWLDDCLLCSSLDGNVHCYHHQPIPTVDVHSTRQQGTYSHAPLMRASYSCGPDSWPHSVRVRKVDLNTDLEHFLSIAHDSFFIWDLSNEARPLYAPIQRRESTAPPLFAAAWSPHRMNVFMVGGARSTLKLVDARNIGKQPSQRFPNAHMDTVRDIAWSPFIEYWFATASDDATVKVWDIRNSRGPVRVLKQHTNAVNCVSWSRSHCEILMSGGSDCTLRLWNLRVQPHCSMTTIQGAFKRSVIGVGFSPASTSYSFVLSEGQFGALECKDEFVQDYVIHRSDIISDIDVQDPHDVQEWQSIETYLHLRDFSNAYKVISSLANKYYDAEEFDKAKSIVKLAGGSLFNKVVQSSENKTFDQLLQDLAFYVPQTAIGISSPEKSVEEKIKLLKLKLALNEHIQSADYIEIVKLQPEILDHLEKLKGEAFDASMLKRLVDAALPFDYLNTLKFCELLAETLKTCGKFLKFHSIAWTLFSPSVYSYLEANNSPSPQQARAAKALMNKSLENIGSVVLHLKLLSNLHDAMAKADPLEIVNLMKAQDRHKILPRSAHLLYFNALLFLDLYADVFIDFTNMVKFLEGSEFSDTIKKMLSQIAFPRFREFLVQSAAPPIKATMTLQILYNCEYLPECLHDFLPGYLIEVTKELEKELKLTGDRSVAEKILREVKEAREKRRTDEAPFFEDQVCAFERMLHRMRDG